MDDGAVLIVDDEPTMVKLAKLTLESAGFQVYGAVNGAEAIALLRQESLGIRVTVMDYELPGTRLSDLLREAQSQSSPIRCIVTSGYSLDMLEELGGALPPGVEFLKKPFLPRELIAAVRGAFSSASGGVG